MTQLSLQTSTALQPSLSPRLQRAVQLLQMSSLDFAQVVRGAANSNPFLEIDDPQADEEAPPAAAQAGEAAADGASADSWGSDPLPRARVEGAEGVFDSLVAPTSLAAHLLGQLSLLPLPERDRVLASVVVESLDEDGYLRTPLDELRQAVLLEPAAEDADMLIALRRVQALDPAGVGARNVGECLSLQLHSIADPEQRALAAAILKDHLPALAGRDTAGLARRLQAEPALVQAACGSIRRFDPHPGWRFGAPSVQYVTPDVIAKRSRGRWTATLNEAVVPRVRVNRDYADLFRSHRCAGDSELGANLQEARWTVRNVEQRFSTILSVAQAILDRQQHFLAYGAMAMKPLALREIAQEVGVHESTVSRVTNNKFMATPCGMFELKYFFSRGLATRSGAECSPTAIRSLIAEMIAAEPPGRPLSDVDIARSLSGQGFQVARRTVTKYRQALRIEPVERRRVSSAVA
jgi:RNA polymerase sigma-54 factor